MAASIASAPEFEKNTFSPKVKLHNFLAYLTDGSLMYRFDRCHRFFDCFETILFSSALLWPRLVTAMPAVRSINLFPFVSQTSDPLAFLTTKSAGI